MAVKLLSGVTATGASAAWKVQDVKEHTLQVDWTSTGSVTALTMDLEGTINNQGEVDAGTAKWFQLGTKTLTAGDLTALSGQLQVIGGPERYIRANITTLTETGTTAVNVRYQGFDGYRRGC